MALEWSVISRKPLAQMAQLTSAMGVAPSSKPLIWVYRAVMRLLADR